MATPAKKKAVKEETKKVAIVIEASHQIALFFRHRHYMVRVLEVPASIAEMMDVDSLQAVFAVGGKVSGFKNRVLAIEEVEIMTPEDLKESVNK